MPDTSAGRFVSHINMYEARERKRAFLGWLLGQARVSYSSEGRFLRKVHDVLDFLAALPTRTLAYGHTLKVAQGMAYICRSIMVAYSQATGTVSAKGYRMIKSHSIE